MSSLNVDGRYGWGVRRVLQMMIACPVTVIHAQIAAPPVQYLGRDVANPLPASAAQGVVNTRRFVLQQASARLDARAHANVDADSMNAAAQGRPRAWLLRIQAGAANSEQAWIREGMQLDNLVRLALGAGRDAEAERYIAARLATSKLPQRDRIYTLQLAFSAFADLKHPARFAVAKTYFQQIDAVGDPSASVWVRGELARRYYTLGVADSVIRYGTQAIEMVRQVPFWQRDLAEIPFMKIVDALIGRPNGRAEITRLGHVLLDAAIPAPEVVAADSGALDMSRRWQSHLNGLINTAARLGQSMPPIVGHFWLNSSHVGYAEQVLADGKIRVIQFGDKQCPPCLASLPVLQRLHEHFAGAPNVEFLYVTHTMGYWGTEVATPAEEVKHLHEYYVDKRGFTFPMAIWAPERAYTDEGDFVVPKSQNLTAFGVVGVPRAFVVDGHGQLRRVIGALIDRDAEQELTDFVSFLIAEAK